MKVQNHDIVAMIRVMRRFEKELEKSVSSGVSELSAFDLGRLVSYVDALTKLKAFTVAQPALDLPESSPLEVELGELEALAEVENDNIAYLLNLFRVFKIELVNSQSARNPSGLINHDGKRFDSYVAKVNEYIKYIGETSPLDYPESSPMVAGTGAGNAGI